jgi:hypothetical protein
LIFLALTAGTALWCGLILPLKDSQMSLPDRLTEHQHILTVATLISAGFVIGNVLSHDRENHLVRDTTVVAAFALATARSVRGMFKNVEYMIDTLNQPSSPREQMDYNVELLRSMAPLPTALAFQFATLPKGDMPMYVAAGILGGVSVGTYFLAHKLQQSARHFA